MCRSHTHKACGPIWANPRPRPGSGRTLAGRRRFGAHGRGGRSVPLRAGKEHRSSAAPVNSCFFLAALRGPKAGPSATLMLHRTIPLFLSMKNTMPETMTGRGLGGPSYWIYSIKRYSRGLCNATRAPAEQSPINPRTIGSTTPWYGHTGIAEACRSLLIPPPCPGGTRGCRRPRHGQRPPPRPPSPFTDSGGRP